jgi:serine/threonine protein kinase
MIKFEFTLRHWGVCSGNFSRAENVQIGTEAYRAPEIHQKLAYGPEVDWWAVGILMYVMLGYRFPFKVPATSGCPDDIFNKKVQYPEWINSSAVSILKWLLTRIQRDD